MILDGLLGLGSRPQLNAALKALTGEINALRLNSNATVYAVDLPTGLGEEGIDPDAVVADFTLTIGFAEDRALSGRRDKLCRSHPRN